MAILCSRLVCDNAQFIMENAKTIGLVVVPEMEDFILKTFIGAVLCTLGHVAGVQIPKAIGDADLNEAAQRTISMLKELGYTRKQSRTP